MSNDKLERASGCSIFSSLILGCLFVSAFFFFQMYFHTEETESPMNSSSDERSQKISDYKKNSSKFEHSIESFHTERNSSLESVMFKTINSYHPKPSNAE
tara:strand:+ start:269 stop:568 length:300 start_codon:yes stop_codon:yes gene_type:complete